MSSGLSPPLDWWVIKPASSAMSLLHHVAAIACPPLFSNVQLNLLRQGAAFVGREKYERLGKGREISLHYLGQQQLLATDLYQFHVKPVSSITNESQPCKRAIFHQLTLSLSATRETQIDKSLHLFWDTCIKHDHCGTVRGSETAIKALTIFIKEKEIFRLQFSRW